MKRQHRCDACDQPRQRWQRLCESCFRALPRDVRSSLINAFKQGRKADWRRLRTRARSIIAQRAADRAAISPQAAFELNERLLGERR